jgi:mono/diheme cytochrome c family protein
MRNETRTRKQIEANRIDMEVFRVAGAMETFAKEFRDPKLWDAAAIIRGQRHRIRKHMHKKDLDATI